MTDIIYHMTPQGYATLKEELDFLQYDERPKIVEIVSWAAGNGDRSENGDYIYNKKRLREIDRRLRYLTKKLEKTKVVDPKTQQNLDRVYFGATVTYLRESGEEMTVKLVDVDEADLRAGKINWHSPVGRALMKAEEGDVVTVRTADQVEELEVIEIAYLIE
ncbi:MAG: transcription elongation factor GreB [Alphaproteobacteria bacterium]|jgi:transcription elongation factor GreB|nr:transcription elongation factor GreB [Alphaproteobacteria bacterium]MDP7221985.1 transcription elongation factor GreB [Alphaproteobacteria bacterium]